MGSPASPQRLDRIEGDLRERKKSFRLKFRTDDLG